MKNRKHQKMTYQYRYMSYCSNGILCHSSIYCRYCQHTFWCTYKVNLNNKTYMKRFSKLLILSIISLFGTVAIVNAKVPSFDESFANYLTDQTNVDARYGKESVFNLCIDRNKSLMTNIRILLYPSSTNITNSECPSNRGGIIRDVIRIVGFVVLFLYIVFAWMEILMNGDDTERIKKAGKWFAYILYGAFLLFGAVWLLGTVLKIENMAWTEMFLDNIQGWPDSLFYKILSFFKAAAFFIAIIMIIYYGFKIMQSMDEEDKIKTAKKWIMNIILALVFIKIIDYVFYIAQVPEFTQKASDLLIQIAIILAYILGAMFIIFVFYAGFLLLTGGASEENVSKVKNIFLTIILSALVIFLFLLILHQIFSEFA